MNSKHASNVSALIKNNFPAISLEIRPLAALYPPKIYTLYSTAILSSALSGRRGWYPHAYSIFPFLLYQSNKIYIWGGGG